MMLTKMKRSMINVAIAATALLMAGMNSLTVVAQTECTQLAVNAGTVIYYNVQIDVDKSTEDIHVSEAPASLPDGFVVVTVKGSNDVETCVGSIKISNASGVNPLLEFRIRDTIQTP